LATAFLAPFFEPVNRLCTRAMCNDFVGVFVCVKGVYGLMFGAEIDFAVEMIHFADGIDMVCDQIRMLVHNHFERYCGPGANQRCRDAWAEGNETAFRNFAVSAMATEREIAGKSMHASGSSVFSSHGVGLKTMFVPLPVPVPCLDVYSELDISDEKSVLGVFNEKDAEYEMGALESIAGEEQEHECISNGEGAFTLAFNVSRSVCIADEHVPCAKACCETQCPLLCAVPDTAFEEAKRRVHV
jgi:hypothetical protein